MPPQPHHFRMEGCPSALPLPHPQIHRFYSGYSGYEAFPAQEGPQEFEAVENLQHNDMVGLKNHGKELPIRDRGKRRLYTTSLCIVGKHKDIRHSEGLMPYSLLEKNCRHTAFCGMRSRQ